MKQKVSPWSASAAPKTWSMPRSCWAICPPIVSRSSPTNPRPISSSSTPAPSSSDAKEESVETILEVADYKKSGRCRLLVVTGCLPQRYREELATELPEVDLFMGTGDAPRIVELLDAHDAGNGPRQAVGAARLPLRPCHSAGQVLPFLLHLRQDRRRVRQPLLLLRHPAAARRAAFAQHPLGGRGGAAAGRRRGCGKST